MSFIIAQPSQVYTGGMGILYNQQDGRTELQKRVAQELTDKAKKKTSEPGELPDGVDDSAYLEGTKKTTSLAWAWVLIAIVAVAILIWFFIASGNQV